MAVLHKDHDHGAGPFAAPTPPASDIGDVAAAEEAPGDCAGCRMIRDKGAWRYEQQQSNDIMASPLPSPSPSKPPSRQQELPQPQMNPSPIQAVNEPPRLQELKHEDSVMAIAVSDKYIFVGVHSGQISVWSLATFELVHQFQAHKRHCEKLLLAETSTRPILVSTAGDAIVSVWCPNTFERLYEIYWLDHIGDVFSCAYSKDLDTLYIGAQNTSIQWIRLGDPDRRSSPYSDNHPRNRHDPFFDSMAISGTRTPRRIDKREALIPPAHDTLEIHRYSIGTRPHTGFVYSMIIARSPTVLVGPDEEVLITGGGEGWIKMWQIKNDPKYDGLHGWAAWPKREIMCLGEADGESIFTLAIDGSFLYSGKHRGVIELWDLDTKQKLRVLKDHYGLNYRKPSNKHIFGDVIHGFNFVRPEDLIHGNVMTLQMAWGHLWSGATTGTVVRHSTVHSNHTSEKVSQKYECLSRWQAHPGKVLVSACTTYEGHKYYITGANDNSLRVWRVDGIEDAPDKDAEEAEPTMVSSLRDFVAYKTVSSRPEFKEDCRQGASYLCNTFRRLGAEVKMLSTTDKTTAKYHNPVVYALFKGKREPAQDRKRILFYGHYDVVPADRPADRDAQNKWVTDPFKMEGRNGYLYGRGVSDNKGPIMAALYAVTDLLQAKQLDSDIIFLIEGEEEFSSRGFQETIRENKAFIGNVDYILLANSYWVDDETPCLTYGLRGLLRATVCVDSSSGDLHSGVYGSRLYDEPQMEVMQLITSLRGPQKKIMVPRFYDDILPMTSEEDARFDDITQILHRYNPNQGTIDKIKSELVTRWREPNFTVHRTSNSGVDDTVMSSHASAVISFRLVPGQQVDEICDNLVAYLNARFAELGSKNKLNIKIDNKAEPWLGDTSNQIFKTLEQAIVKVWGLAGSASNGQSADATEQVDGEEPEASAARVEGEEPSKSKSADSSPDSPSDEAGSASKGKKLLYIREGGSIPAIRFLEKEFDAPVAHLPCGQASDAAHLENERIRLLNLIRSREIFGEVFRKL